MKNKLVNSSKVANYISADDTSDFVHPRILLKNKELSESHYQVINQLPQKQKTAFVLLQLEDLSYVDISIANQRKILYSQKQVTDDSILNQIGLLHQGI
jgi:DNA-directed RNA polymerase specialized sigma24 family protein